MVLIQTLPRSPLDKDIEAMTTPDIGKLRDEITADNLTRQAREEFKRAREEQEELNFIRATAYLLTHSEERSEKV